jgi:TRAP-type C4-dicarboxylate transport system permease small subunit
MQKFMVGLARLMALIGGMVLTALVLLTCASVIGRGLNTFGHSAFFEGISQAAADGLIALGVGPISGDFELVEAGIAFAIFSFLPICQLFSAHATVDVFASYFPERVNKVLIAVWEIALAILIILITWRLFAGLEGKLRYGETTFLLRMPVWWAYSASFFASCIASIVSVYCAYARTAEAITGRRFMPSSEGAVH